MSIDDKVFKEFNKVKSKVFKKGYDVGPLVSDYMNYIMDYKNETYKKAYNQTLKKYKLLIKK